MLTDGGGGALGLGFVVGLRLGMVLVFLDGWDWVWDLPFFLVFTMVRVRNFLKVRVRFCGGEEEFGLVDDEDEG